MEKISQIELDRMNAAVKELAGFRKQIERAAYPGNRHERRKAMAKDRRSA